MNRLGESAGRREGAGLLECTEASRLCAPPASLIDDPLEFFLAEHYQQRQLAKFLESISDGVINLATIERIGEFLRRDLRAHILDEEGCFFPALIATCKAEDEIGKLLGLLTAEHKEDEILATRADTVLRSLQEGKPQPRKRLEILRAFAEHLRGHIALENGVLLPIARIRLDAQRLREIAACIKQRRSAALAID